MENINAKKLTRELIEKAMACKTAEELVAVAKTDGIELTKEEAEAYMNELTSIELDDETLDKVAGGKGKWACHDCLVLF